MNTLNIFAALAGTLPVIGEPGRMSLAFGAGNIEWRSDTIKGAGCYELHDLKRIAAVLKARGSKEIDLSEWGTPSTADIIEIGVATGPWWFMRGKLFKQLVSMTADPTRPTMHGLIYGDGMLVVTDGHRLTALPCPDNDAPRTYGERPALKHIARAATARDQWCLARTERGLRLGGGEVAVELFDCGQRPPKWDAFVGPQGFVHHTTDTIEIDQTAVKVAIACKEPWVQLTEKIWADPKYLRDAIALGGPTCSVAPGGNFNGLVFRDDASGLVHYLASRTH